MLDYRPETELSAFADPATPFESSDLMAGVLVKMIREGVEREYLFHSTTSRITARHDNERQFSSLSSLLASDHFADMPWLADVQRRLLGQRLSKRRWIDHEGLVELANGEIIPLDQQAITDVFSVPSSESRISAARPRRQVKVVLIDGPAGVGKTALIERLVQRRAESYGRDGFAPPILHVTSRGQRLTNLQSALAQATQTVRAKFTYDQVPALIRHNILQLAIDGFDELVDADGYQDAWYALQNLLSDVAAGGPILLAGRDTFFDQQGFLKRIAGFGGKVLVDQVHLETVTPQSAITFLKHSDWPDTELHSNVANDVIKQDSYVLRPYFLTLIAEMKSWSAFSPPAQTLRQFLVDSLTEREADILSGRVHLATSTALSMLNRLYNEVAADMADNETDSIDVDLIRLLIEMHFGDALDDADLAKLMHSAGSLALFEDDQRLGRRRFKHSELSNYFLARVIIEQICGSKISRFLRRGVMGLDLQEAIADAYLSLNGSDAQSFVNGIMRSGVLTSSSDRSAYNIGSLHILSLMRNEDGRERRLLSVQAQEAMLSEAVPRAELVDCVIDRFDVQGADLRDVIFTDTTTTTLVVDSATRFGNTTPSNIYSLQIFEHGHSRTIYDDKAIKAYLQMKGSQVDGDIASNQYTRLLERVCYRLLKRYFIKDSDDDSASVLLRDAAWQTVESVLLQHNRIQIRDDVQAAGRNARFYHIIDPRSLLGMDPNDVSSTSIWHALRSIST